jgi:hypothetical protein
MRKYFAVSSSGNAAVVLSPSRSSGSPRFGLHRSLAENRRRREYLERGGGPLQPVAMDLRQAPMRVLTGRDEAKEIRAFGLGDELRGRWDAGYAREIESLVGVQRRYVRSKIVARLLGDAVTLGVIAVVWMLVVRGAIELPTALAVLTGLFRRTSAGAGRRSAERRSWTWTRCLHSFSFIGCRDGTHFHEYPVRMAEAIAHTSGTCAVFKFVTTSCGLGRHPVPAEALDVRAPVEVTVAARLQVAILGGIAETL